MFADGGIANVTLQGFTICGVSSDKVCEDTELGSFARDAGSRSKSCSPGLIAERRCLRFLRATPKGIWMPYDRGVGFLAMIFLDVFPPYVFFADRASHELSHLAIYT